MAVKAFASCGAESGAGAAGGSIVSVLASLVATAVSPASLLVLYITIDLFSEDIIPLYPPSY